MFVSLSSLTFDIDGHVKIETLPDNTNGATRRRVSRVPTLDGGVAVNDRGYSEGDRDMAFTWRTVSRKHNDLIDRLVRLYPSLYVSTRDGVYLASPDTFTPGADISAITLLVTEKMT